MVISCTTTWLTKLQLGWLGCGIVGLQLKCNSVNSVSGDNWGVTRTYIIACSFDYFWFFCIWMYTSQIGRRSHRWHRTLNYLSSALSSVASTSSARKWIICLFEFIRIFLERWQSLANFDIACWVSTTFVFANMCWHVGFQTSPQHVLKSMRFFLLQREYFFYHLSILDSLI